MNKWFLSLSSRVSKIIGNPYTFIIAVALTVVWLISGPFLHFGVGWNFIANTSTTITTWLIVFLIQHSTNVGNSAIQLKLDQVIVAIKEADNRFTAIEEKTEPELEELKKEILDHIDNETLPSV